MILALSPHTDDTDLGCGGYIYERRHDTTIKVIAFSDCDNPHTSLEFYGAQDLLGVSESKVLTLKRRTFHMERQRILDIMLMYDPDIVLVPSTGDCHQDHQVITQEAIRAFKRRTILGYFLPWNNVTNMKPNGFFELSPLAVDKKVEALSRYKSQSGRPYMAERHIRGVMATYGMMAGVHDAEAFEIIRYNL